MDVYFFVLGHRMDMLRGASIEVLAINNVVMVFNSIEDARALQMSGKLPTVKGVPPEDWKIAGASVEELRTYNFITVPIGSNAFKESFRMALEGSNGEG